MLIKVKLKHGKSASKLKGRQIAICVLLLLGVNFFMHCCKQNENSQGQNNTDVVKNEGSISIPGYETLTLRADTKQQEVALNNPAENTCYFVISLYLEDGTKLWESDLIKPGESSDSIKIDRKLDEGNYSAIIHYSCFKMDEYKTPLNGAEIKLTLRVK